MSFIGDLRGARALLQRASDEISQMQEEGTQVLTTLQLSEIVSEVRGIRALVRRVEEAQKMYSDIACLVAGKE